jgi:GPI-anchor transamidase subunit S
MATPTSTPVVAESGAKGDDLGKGEDAPVNAVNAVSAKKEPPPEKPEEIRMRSFVLLSFWAIIILLGLPIWWRTTTIYRANLPLDQMMDWADGRVCAPPLNHAFETDRLYRHADQSSPSKFPYKQIHYKTTKPNTS